MEKKLKSISVTKFDYLIRNGFDEEVDEQGYPNHYTLFNEEGRLLKEIRYNSIGEFEEMFEYTYDDRGFLAEESYSPVEDEVAEKKVFIRNEGGEILRVLKHYQDGSVDTITYEYQEQGKPSRLVTTNDDGEVDQVETLQWENDELVGHVVVDGEGELVSEADFSQVPSTPSRVTHNDQGQVIMEEEIGEDGEVYMTVNRSYDEAGRAGQVDVFIDGRGRTLTRHYFLEYEYTFFD
jgi:hypothetical protein